MARTAMSLRVAAAEPVVALRSLLLPRTLTNIAVFHPLLRSAFALLHRHSLCRVRLRRSTQERARKSWLSKETTLIDLNAWCTLADNQNYSLSIYY